MGCAPRSGWVRTDQVCQPADPPRVCFEADPDAPLTLRVGGATLVPGECAEAPKDRRAVLSAIVVDGRSGDEHRVRVGSGRGRTATVTAREDEGELDVEVRRSGC